MALTLEQRKAYALDLKNNPLLGDILEEMAQDVLSRWRGTKENDVAAREQAWVKARAIEEVASRIESVLSRALEAESETEEEAH